MVSVVILNTRVLPQEMALMNVELTAEWKIESALIWMVGFQILKPFVAVCE